MRGRFEPYRLLEYLYAGVQFEIEVAADINGACLRRAAPGCFEVCGATLAAVQPSMRDEQQYHEYVTCELASGQAVVHAPFCLRLAGGPPGCGLRQPAVGAAEPADGAPRASVFRQLLGATPLDAANLLDPEPVRAEAPAVAGGRFNISDRSAATGGLPAVPARLTARFLAGHIGQLSDDYLLAGGRADVAEFADFKDTFEQFMTAMDKKTASLRRKLLERRARPPPCSAPPEPPETSETTTHPEPAAACPEPAVCPEPPAARPDPFVCTAVFTRDKDRYLARLRAAAAGHDVDYERLYATMERLYEQCAEIIRFVDGGTKIQCRNDQTVQFLLQIKDSALLAPVLKVFMCLVQNLLLGQDWGILTAVLNCLQAQV